MFSRVFAILSLFLTSFFSSVAPLADPQALALDPGYWPALESLENVKSLAVDRWHFRMLNHSARNEAYARAIQRAVTSAAASHRSRGSQARSLHSLLRRSVSFTLNTRLSVFLAVHEVRGAVVFVIVVFRRGSCIAATAVCVTLNIFARR